VGHLGVYGTSLLKQSIINAAWWFQSPEKYESQLGSLFPIYILKEKNMFQTTNQNGNFRNLNMAIWPEIYGTNVTPFGDPGIPIEMKEQ